MRPLQSLGDFNPIGADFLHRLPVVPYERLFVLKEADADKPMEAISRIYGPTLQSWVLGRIELHLFEAQAHAQGTFSEGLRRRNRYLRTEGQYFGLHLARQRAPLQSRL